MRFQNVKPEELEGPVKLPGFCDWAKGLRSGSDVTSVLLTAPSGAGKGSAIGVMAQNLHYDVVRCRLSQLLEYPDPSREFRALLNGTEHLHRTVIWLDGIDRLLPRLSNGTGSGEQILESWLKTERDALKNNGAVVVATAREQDGMADSVVGAFEHSFAS
jgi:AAA+ superfamily predicted ATPase